MSNIIAHGIVSVFDVNRVVNQMDIVFSAYSLKFIYIENNLKEGTIFYIYTLIFNIYDTNYMYMQMV